MIIWILFFGAFVFYQLKVRRALFLNNFPKVSVVICARNEAENLRKNLQFVLNQNFTTFEVIVVNDCSNDGTVDILKDYQKNYNNLRIVNLSEKKGKGKKYALLEGLRAASNDWILLTDADCKPVSEYWISEMLSSVSDEKTKIVLGFAPHFERKGILSKWIDFETCFTALQYFSAAFWRIPYMGVGRNLLFNRSLLESYEKSIQSNDLSSGDDDLFINAVSNQENTEISISKNSFVYSEPKSSFKELYIQKTRHYSTGTAYRTTHKVLLSLIFFSQIFFWIFFLISLIISPLHAFILLILRLITIFLIWSKLLSIFENKKLLLYVLIFDLILPIYYLIFSPSLLFFKNKNKWK